MVKSFILDTSVILSSGTGGGKNVLYGFGGGADENNVVITGTVLQELDRKKDAPGEVGYNARDFIRKLDELRAQGDLTKGVKIERGMVIIEPNGVKEDLLPAGFSISSPDNRIISTCIYLAKKNPQNAYVYVSNDVSCRCNADACFKAARVNIPIQSYHNDRIILEEYNGFIEKEIEDYSVIEKIYKESKNKNSFENPTEEELVENEFIRLYSGTLSALLINKNNRLQLIKDKDVSAFGITPRNALQSFALYALLAPPEDIPLVILNGPAGTGKTFLALAAGLEKTYDDKRNALYDRIMITRNNAIPEKENLGYLKGTLEDKMAPLLLPYQDALISLLKKDEDESMDYINAHVEDLFESGVIEMFSMAYIRGRSIPDAYIIVDEAQNLTRTQMRDLLTRCSNGTKLVLSGDLNQIDAPYLDKYTSGLSYALQKMKGPLCAEITFSEKECQRSPLASAALERLAERSKN